MGSRAAENRTRWRSLTAASAERNLLSNLSQPATLVVVDFQWISLRGKPPRPEQYRRYIAIGYRKAGSAIAVGLTTKLSLQPSVEPKA